MTEEQLSQCIGKTAYQSRSLANKVLRRRNRGGRRLNVYKCPHCHQWHMGTLFKLKQRRRPRRRRFWR